MTSPEHLIYTGPTLGELIRHERLKVGTSFRTLSEQSGLSVGQLHKLESDRVQKPNAAHLAAIAGPLNVPLSHLYTAAGYDVGEPSGRESDLIQKLIELSPTALASVARLVDKFIAAGDQRTAIPVPIRIEDEYPDEPQQEQEGGNAP